MRAIRKQSFRIPIYRRTKKKEKRQEDERDIEKLQRNGDNNTLPRDQETRGHATTNKTRNGKSS